MAVRTVRFEYYQVTFRTEDDAPNVRDRLFDLLQWLETANRSSLEGRTFDYKEERARLEEGYWDEEAGFLFLHFGRLRDRNIPHKASAGAIAIPIELEDDEYIGENVSALYDEDNHVLMLQRNKYSLGPEGIEEYLNLIWNNNQEKIYLRPIMPPNTFQEVREARDYRKINLKFADMNALEERRWQDFARNPITRVLDVFREFDSVNAQIVITVGNQRDASLSQDTVNDTLNFIQDNEDLFSKAEVAFKSNEDTKVELVDLFNHKAHDFAAFRMEAKESLNPIRVDEEMAVIYGVGDGRRGRKIEIDRYLRR